MLFIIILYFYLLLLITNYQCKIISSPSQYWLKHPNPPEPNRRENLYFYLKQQNNDILNDHLLIASNPNHHLYHKTPWLTLDQINSIVRPDPISIKVETN
jgi:hypothetical protein